MIAGGLALILMPLLIQDTFLLNAMILVFSSGQWRRVGT